MIKGLIENECAGQNSLMKLAASHFTNSSEQKLTQVSVFFFRILEKKIPIFFSENPVLSKLKVIINNICICFFFWRIIAQ